MFIIRYLGYIWQLLTDRTILIYVGCKLTNAPQPYVDAIEEFKRWLSQQSVNGRKIKVFDFLGVSKGTSRDVYRWDIKRCVRKCKFFLAIATLESTGLGYEIGVAIEKYGKYVMAAYEKGIKLTRLVAGVDDPRFSLVEYVDLEQLKIQTMERLEELYGMSMGDRIGIWFQKKLNVLRHHIWVVDTETRPITA